MQRLVFLEVVMFIRQVERLRGNSRKRPLMLLIAGTTLVAGAIYGGVQGWARSNATTIPEIVIQADPSESNPSRTAELHAPVPNR
jgi:hypothetical protein